MITLNKETHDELIELIEDSVEYWVNEAMKNGELVSGETAWKIISTLAITKEVEFAGGFNEVTSS